MNRNIALGIVCIILLVAAFATYISIINNRNNSVNTKNIFNVCTLIGGGGEQVDSLLNFLAEINYHKWTIIIVSDAKQYLWSNPSKLELLKTYGEIIGAAYLLQGCEPSARKGYIDDYIIEFENHLGFKPKGFFMFMPDTYLANYMYSIGMTYIHGYCFDQYAIDWMTMRGGWQYPYYADENHVLKPSKTKGLVVLPHVIWDWRDSFEISHQQCSHPAGLKGQYNTTQTAIDYTLLMMENTYKGSSPFGFFTAMSEWGWIGLDDYSINFFKSLIAKASELGAVPMTNAEVAEWYINTYNTNPTTRINYTTPFTRKNVEWYFSIDKRVTRYDKTRVVGYVDYNNQKDDPYLTKPASVNFSGSANDPKNCADNSLNFVIDDFGDGEYRAPPKGNSVYYTGDLADFP